VTGWQAGRVHPQELPEDEAADEAAGRSWGQRVHHHLHRNRAMSATTKLVVTIVGSAVLTAGLIMMVTPGPGLVGIVAGLAILATEWDWADRWLRAARRELHEAKVAAEQMDPRVRRRRILLTAGAVAAGVGGASAYVALKDWPGWSVSAWDRAQSFLGFLPDLPGM
jgi:uncharacterized protein (TIGR02611 family)